jgi:ornithine carbamoyltransferase
LVRHVIDLFELTPAEARELVESAIALKRADRKGLRSPLLAGKTLGLLFEKPSLRTRVSFESAITHLGGNTVFLHGQDVGLGVRETIADFARVISQYVDALAVRTHSHLTIEELARHATVPVINALCDTAHPCQAMADMMTLREALGRTEGVRLVFVGDGNNVARSLAVASAVMGVEFVLACPPGYDFPADFQARFGEHFPAISLRIEHDPRTAVAAADAVYTDVWASMGQEAEAETRRSDFARFQVDAALMAAASPEAVFLHCLPAHRGEEVTADVLEGPRSLVIPQAANRLHLQKQLLVWLLQDCQPGVSVRHPGPRKRSRRF